MVQTTYQKKNGELVNKITYFRGQYKIGEENGFGWKVVDIKCKFKDNFYPMYEYDRLIQKHWKREDTIDEIKKKFKKIYVFFVNFLGYMILYKILEFIVLNVI